MARLRALVVALLLLPVLGCEDEPTPDLPDPTPSSSAPSPSETEPSPTPTPEALTPEETVRAWVDARNQALQDGDTSGAEALSAPECRSCRELLDPVRKIYEAGGSFDTKGWTIAGIKEETGVDPVRVNTSMDFAGGTTVSEAGAEPLVYEPEKHVIVFELTGPADARRISLVLFLS